MKPCLVCLTPTSGTRCPSCERAHERQRGTPTQRGYTYAWSRIVAEAIEAQPWCSVCGATADLTGDHIVPLSRGGSNDRANCRVLCRSCNSAKGARQGGRSICVLPQIAGVPVAIPFGKLPNSQRLSFRRGLNDA